MWDGRLATLEEQALGPIQFPGEMNMPLEQLTERLSSIAEYKPLFAAAFPEETLTIDTLAQSHLDLRTDGGVRADLRSTPGLRATSRPFPKQPSAASLFFNTKAQCSACHEGWNFTNDSFQDIGLPSEDVGRGKFMIGVVKMAHAFKTPGLREITRRSPYMHDGSLATLEQVVEHYDRGGVERPSRSDLMKRLDLTPQEKSDLVEFMKTLTSDFDPTTVPVLPR